MWIAALQKKCAEEQIYATTDMFCKQEYPRILSNLSSLVSETALHHSAALQKKTNTSPQCCFTNRDFISFHSFDLWWDWLVNRVFEEGHRLQRKTLTWRLEYSSTMSDQYTARNLNFLKILKVYFGDRHSAASTKTLLMMPKYISSKDWLWAFFSYNIHR